MRQSRDPYDAVQDTRSETRYEHTPTDAETERIEEQRWGLGGDGTRVEGDSE